MMYSTRFLDSATTTLRGVIVCLGLLVLSSLPASAAEQRSDKIRLLVCGDDIGVASAFLDGAIQGYQHGVLRSVNVIVPGPWFPDAVQRLSQMPEMGVGLHIALTSEWDQLKYPPLTFSPTLRDENGYFFEFGPQLFRHRPDMAEVEREFRAQIEMIKRRIPRVGWIWPHMGVATSTPELRNLTLRLAREYNLPLLGTDPGIKIINHPGLASLSDDQTKARTIVKVLKELQPGSYFLITHPSVDTPEVRKLNHPPSSDCKACRPDAGNLAERRLADVQLILTNLHVRQVVKERGIELMTPTQAVQALQTGIGRQ
jgi:predicted glycoside hydrolase/deacetylase ChbG (UPF0249 family)